MEQQAELVEIFIDDKSYKVPITKTVMEVASENKVFVPHFCWHPGLSIAGVCRFCMVEVEGRPKLEIACNLKVAPGMKIFTKSSKTKDAQKWALEFHLVNHPLDCPICDQAGECGLQDYYMSVGRYKSQMDRPKVLKPKVVDVGSELVLDTERCILCSRCVRFEDEVTKTGGLGIFSRGDRSIVNTYNENKITHKYQENIVDICPVGAFTSKDFRFKQRVWFLKKYDSICPGCSTGCSINVQCKPDFGEYYRIKPRLDEEVNKHWMCDDGRKLVHQMKFEDQLIEPYFYEQTQQQFVPISEQILFQDLGTHMKAQKPEDRGLLIAPSYTNEEFLEILTFWKNHAPGSEVFEWRTQTGDENSFDNILIRGDKYPNTKGLRKIAKDLGFKISVPENFATLPKNLIALACEFVSSEDLFNEQLNALNQKEFVSLWGFHNTFKGFSFAQLLPMRRFCEKSGTFLNYANMERKLNDPVKITFEATMDVKDATKKLQAKWI